MAEQVIVNISPLGEVSIDAQGFHGRKCNEATQQLELVLGGGTVQKKPKPEMFAPAGQGAQATHRRL